MNSILPKLFVISTILIIGCTDSGDISGTTNTNEIEQTTICPPKKNNTVSRPNIQGINVFMEVSGSMKGFMPSGSASTDFQKLIPDLLARLNTDLPQSNFHVLAQANKPINKIDINTARNQIAFGRFSFGSSSLLPVMFDSSLSNLSANKVSILITDAIYSPSASNSRVRDQAISDIRTIILKASSQGYSVSCFSLLSQFEKINSPYYLFVTGLPQNIALFKEKLKSSLAAVDPNIINKGFNEIQIGFPVLNPFYSIIPYVDNTGAGEPVECSNWDNRYLAMENVKIKNVPEFWVGIDLSSCPSFAQQKDYLKTNLKISGSGIKAVMVNQILDKAQFSSKITDPVDKEKSDKCTHFVRIRITGLDDKTGELSLSLQKIPPNWINDLNHDNDKIAESFREKTYGIKNVIAGIKDAFDQKETEYFFSDLKLIMLK